MSLSKRVLKKRSKRNRPKIKYIQVTVSITDLSDIMQTHLSEAAQIRSGFKETIDLVQTPSDVVQLPDGRMVRWDHKTGAMDENIPGIGKVFVVASDVFRNIKESLLKSELVIPAGITTQEEFDKWMDGDEWRSPELIAAIGDVAFVKEAYTWATITPENQPEELKRLAQDINVEDAYPKGPFFGVKDET